MNVLTNSLVEIALTLLGLAGSALLAFVTPHLRTWIKTLREKDDLGIVETLAARAAELAEERFKGEAGAEKFERAVDIVNDMLSKYNITVDEEVVRSNIQKGYNQFVKQEGQDPLADLEEAFTDYETEEEQGVPVYKEETETEPEA